MTDGLDDDTRTARSPAFRALLARKQRFLIPASAFFFVFYFALPVMTGYFPAAANRLAVGPISWAWLFAFAQFIMIWTLCAVYVRRAAAFDADAQAVAQSEEHTEGGSNGL